MNDFFVSAAFTTSKLRRRWAFCHHDDELFAQICHAGSAAGEPRQQRSIVDIGSRMLPPLTQSRSPHRPTSDAHRPPGPTLDLHPPRDRERLREQRLLENLAREELAPMAGVSIGALQKLERDGQTSMSTFLRVTQALGLPPELDPLLQKRARSIEDLERIATVLIRQRARKARP